jgi:hypothetical protein
MYPNKTWQHSSDVVQFLTQQIDLWRILSAIQQESTAYKPTGFLIQTRRLYGFGGYVKQSSKIALGKESQVDRASDPSDQTKGTLRL